MEDNITKDSDVSKDFTLNIVKVNARKLASDEEEKGGPAVKRQKGIQYLKFSAGCFKPNTKYKKMSEKETTEMLFRMNITVTSSSDKLPEDTRKCIFCHQIGDGVADGPSRLLNFDVDKWVQFFCSNWKIIIHSFSINT